MSETPTAAAAPATPPGGGYEFEITGGAYCLDFANTVSERASEDPVERLNTYSDLLSWARQTEALPTPWLHRLASRAAEQPDAAAAVLERGREVREAIFRLFTAWAAGARPGDEAWRRQGVNADLGTVQSALPEALAHRKLEASAPEAREATSGHDGGAFLWTWAESDDLAAPLWPVLGSAAEVLTGDELPRVRECDSDSCRWLFLDCSRNRSRRWCDMQVCGNRAKARRHYRRQQKSC